MQKLADRLPDSSNYIQQIWQLWSLIGASLSEPHTSVTAFAEVVCMYVCLFVAI